MSEILCQSELWDYGQTDEKIWAIIHESEYIKTIADIEVSIKELILFLKSLHYVHIK